MVSDLQCAHGDIVIGHCTHGLFRGKILQDNGGTVTVEMLELLGDDLISRADVRDLVIRIPYSDIRENTTSKYRFIKERKCHEAVDELKSL